MPWCWLIDPLGRTLEAYRLEGELWLEIGTWQDDEKVRVPPFDAVELELAGLWSPGEP